MQLDNEMMSKDGRGKNPKVYWSKSKEHTMTRQSPKYDNNGRLINAGETIQFREHTFRTNLSPIKKFIEESSDFNHLVFDDPKKAGILEVKEEQVLTMMGTDLGSMEPSEDGSQRTYKKETAEYEEPPENAPEDVE